MWLGVACNSRLGRFHSFDSIAQFSWTYGLIESIVNINSFNPSCGMWAGWIDGKESKDARSLFSACVKTWKTTGFDIHFLISNDHEFNRWIGTNIKLQDCCYSKASCLGMQGDLTINSTIFVWWCIHEVITQVRAVNVTNGYINKKWKDFCPFLSAKSSQPVNNRKQYKVVFPQIERIPKKNGYKIVKTVRWLITTHSDQSGHWLSRANWIPYARY